MKKLLLFVLAITATTTTLFAQTIGDIFTVGDLNYTVTNDYPYEVEVSGASGSATDIIIPATVADLTPQTFNVVAIGVNAFLSNVTLETVSLPASVLTIKDKAFQKCNVLTTIGDASNVETIGSGVFLDCYVLASMDVSSVTSLGGNSFREARAIESLVFSSLTIAVGNAANRMPNITESHWPVIETFGNYNVYECESLANLYLGSTLTAFEAQTFHSAGSFLLHIDNDTPIDATILSLDHNVGGITVVVPTAAGVTAYNAAASWGRFADIVSQSELLTAVGYVFTEGDYTYTVTSSDPIEAALSGSTLTALDVPASVTVSGVTYAITSVEANAFENDSSITSVLLPSSITEIGDWAFSKCSSLTSLDTADIAIIGQNILRDTPGITTLDLSEVTTIASNGLGRVPNLTGTLNLPKVETMGPYAFVGPDTATGTHITGLNLGSSLTEVSENTFYRLRDLALLTVATDTPPVLADAKTAFALAATPFSEVVSTIVFEVPTLTGVSNYGIDAAWSVFTNISDNGALLNTDNVNTEVFSVYPNPANNVVYVKTVSGNTANTAVYDITGKLLFSTTNTQVDISNLGSGMYIFKITTSDNIQLVKRIIKN